MNWRHFTGGACLAIPMITLGIAGMLKLADVPAFVASLRAWRSLPNFVIPTVALAVPAMEFVLGAAWLLLGRPRWSVWLALAFLLVFTGAYVVESTTHAPPKCGCFGALSQGIWSDHIWAVLFRNCTLVALLLAGISLISPRKTWPARSRDATALDSTGARAFSVLEVLVVIGVIATIIAILAPKLAAARRSAKDLQQSSQLRGHTQVFALYRNDNKGTFPFLTDPLREVSEVRCEAANLTISLRYFDVWNAWSVGLADSYYNGNPASAGFRLRDQSAATGTAFLYPIVYLTRPEYWDRESRTSLERQAGPTSDQDVSFPSNKIVIGEWRYQPDWDPTRDLQPLAFVDGHADLILTNTLLERAPIERAFPRYSSFPSLAQFVFFYTRDGVRGRDVP